MSTSATRKAGGFSLLEIVVVLAVLSIVVLVFTSTIKESMDVGKVATTDAELRAKAQGALARIVQDLRSTQARYVDLSGMSASPRLMTLRPITGTLSTAPYYTVSGPTQLTQYSWDPTQTTGGWSGANSSWTLSTLILTPWDRPSLAVKLTGEVTDFQVKALGTTATSGFPSTAPQTFEVLLTLSRRGLFGPPATGTNGKLLTVTVTTRVTVPG